MLLNKTLVAGAIMLSVTAPAHAINIVFDYSFDTNNFFSNAFAKASLEAAGSYFSDLITDDLSAITSSGSNHFNANVTRPDTGVSQLINDYSVLANEVVVFAGGRSLSGSTLGRGGPGGWSASGNGAFFTTIYERGEGAVTSNSQGTAVEFAPWGGAITFDNDGSSTWHYDHTTAVAAGAADFFSVALHEIGHLLGIGTADSWDNLESSGNFTGAKSVTEHGGVIPLQSGSGHWANGTSSFVDGVVQEVAMDPSILLGTRKVFTDLDVAGLDDLGWDIAVTAVPLPPAVLLFGSGLLGLLGLSKKKQKNA